MINLVFSNKGSKDPAYPEGDKDLFVGPFNSVDLPPVPWDKLVVGTLGDAKFEYEVKRTSTGWAIKIGSTTFERANFTIR